MPFFQDMNRNCFNGFAYGFMKRQMKTENAFRMRFYKYKMENQLKCLMFFC